TDASGNATPNSFAVSVVTTPTTDVAILKTAVLGPVVAGKDTLTYTLTVTNLSPTTAHQVVVTDQVPAGLDLWSVGTSGLTSCGSNDVTHVIQCTIPVLAQNEHATVTIATFVKAPGTVANTATVTSQ